MVLCNNGLRHSRFSYDGGTKTHPLPVWTDGYLQAIGHGCQKKAGT